MPSMSADGDVIDIALHTVKVQNFDKTITTIPTHKLITDSYRNWRGMTEAGGRRIKRAIHIDQSTIRFMSDEEADGLRRFRILGPYLAAKEAELGEWNAKNAGETHSGESPVNARRLTNMGTFRAYVVAYLQKHPHVRADMTIMVRQLPPAPEGLPLEIYCFTDTTAWGEYEAIQSDIFDHLIAILPELRGQGAGAQLLARGEAEAAARGARRVFLEVSTLNASAKSLYFRVGYSEIGRRRGYYSDGSDALVLEKTLGNDGQGGGAALINRLNE